MSFFAMKFALLYVERGGQEMAWGSHCLPSQVGSEE